MAFPSLVGGLAAGKEDVDASLFYIMLAAIFICIYIIRMVRRISRTTVLLGTAALLVERIVSLSLRATFANRPPSAQSDGLIEYMQTSLATGYLALVVDNMNLLRCLLVNSTYPSDPVDADVPPSPISDLTLSSLISNSANPPTPDHSQSSRRQSQDIITPSPPTFDEKEVRSKNSTASSLFGSSSTGSQTLVESEDQPWRRFWIRRIHEAGCLLALGALVTGIAGNVMVVSQHRDAQKSRINQILRLTSTSIIIFLTLFVAGMTMWARNFRRVNPKAVQWLVVLSLLLAVPGAYRLVVMQRTTTAYDAKEPGAFDSSDAKGAFYALHIMPEFIVSGLLCSLNVRRKFGTGLRGDHRWRDETAEEMGKREEKEYENKDEELQKDI